MVKISILLPVISIIYLFTFDFFAHFNLYVGSKKYECRSMIGQFSDACRSTVGVTLFVYLLLI